MTKQITAPNWDLTDFYSSISDKKITSDFTKITKEVVEFNKKYAGKIAKISAKNLFEAIQSYEKISEYIGKIASYSYLVYASDLSNQKNIAFHQNINEKLSAFESDLVFFSNSSSVASLSSESEVLIFVFSASKAKTSSEI